MEYTPNRVHYSKALYFLRFERRRSLSSAGKYHLAYQDEAVQRRDIGDDDLDLPKTKAVSVP